MKSLFIIGGDYVDQSIANNLCSILAQGTGEATTKDNQLRVHALKTFHPALSIPKCPPLLMEVTFWIIGEYSHLSSSLSTAELIIEISAFLEQSCSFYSGRVRDVAITALWKLLARDSSLIEDVLEVLKEIRHCKSFITQQIVYESLVLLKDTRLLQQCVFPEGEMENCEVSMLCKI